MSLRPMYEYKVIEGRGSLENRLNLYGVHGWQLVAAEWGPTATFVFMRERQVDASTDERRTPLPDLANK